MQLEGLVAESGLAQQGLLSSTSGDMNVEVTAIAMDSHAVTPGALFACVTGEHSDGHEFAPEALAAGAASLLCEHPLEIDAPQAVVTSVRRALGPVADTFFGHPSRALTVVGVTGTSGKTTTCAFLRAVLEAGGLRATSIGTLTQQRTTPEAPALQALLAGWRDSGGQAVAMEVSSHALDQHRVDATRFAAGVFTNLSPEHLDYHHTMEAYFDAKALLFEAGRASLAVVNGADPWGQKLIARLEGGAVPVEVFSVEEVEDLELLPDGSRFRWRGTELSVHLPGRFNVANALAAATCAGALGIDPAAVAEGLSEVQGVRGRFERVDAGQPFTVLVDYAHKPDALNQALGAARELTRGRLLVVFGAGGDRDRDKRPLMGAIAAALADLAIVTSDNPRSEDPGRIIEEILAGAEGRPNVVVEPDRGAAIAAALANAQPGDVVVIAGKGHETGQDIGGHVVPFDDAEVARDALVRILASRRSAP